MKLTKKMLKSVLSSLLFIIIVGVIASCSAGKSMSSKEPACIDIANAVKDACSFPEMIELVQKPFLNLFKVDNSIIDSYAVLESSSGATADEVAVIKVKGDDDLTIKKNINEISKTYTARVADQTDAFANYIPEELPKLKKALIKSTGKYIYLVVANDISRAENVISTQFN